MLAGHDDVAVVIVAGGAGVRLGPGAPKALRVLAGAPLLVHAARAVAGASGVGWMVVVAPPGDESTVAALLKPHAPPGGQLTVVTGGAERQASVAAGLAALPAAFEIVLVHDAARALTPSSLIVDVAAAVRGGHDAVIPVLPVTDTIAELDAAGRVVGNPDRARLRAVQTPQGFRRDVLTAAHAAHPTVAATDDAGLVARLGIPVHTVTGSPYAMKVTTPADLVVAEALYAAGHRTAS